jgi:hypothetical protein
VVRSHIIEDFEEVLLFSKKIFKVGLMAGSVSERGVKLTLRGWNETLEIHKIFSQGACLIEATEADHTPRDDFVLFNTEDRLVFELFDCIDDSESHADWQGRRNSNNYQI